LKLSVIIPVHNEEDSIRVLYQELIDALENLDQGFELIFIDDGSTDQSFNVLSKLHKDDARVIVVSFRRNFGQTAALSAGFDYARGDIIITLDADLQNDPHDIPKLLEKIRSRI